MKTVESRIKTIDIDLNEQKEKLGLAEEIPLLELDLIPNEEGQVIGLRYAYKEA